MGNPGENMVKKFRILSVLSAIVAIGVLIVSGVLLNQAIGYRDIFYYGAGGGGYPYDHYGRSGSDRSGGAAISRTFGFGGSFYGGKGGYGGKGYYGGIGYQDIGYDIYRYQRIIAVSAVALVAGLIQLVMSFVLGCVKENNVKGIAIAYISGSLFVFIVLVVCFGLAFQYRVVYPYYFYNYYQLYQFPSAYGFGNQYNPEGQAFIALLAISLIYLIVSSIITGVFARSVGFGEGKNEAEWKIIPPTVSSTIREYRV